MTDDERQALAEALRAARADNGLTVREVARRASVDVGTVSLLENAKISSPRIDSVRAIAQVVGIPLADLYAMLNWLPADELPTLRPYMRAKYDELTDADLSRVEAFIDELTGHHGRTTGPRDHEDER